MVTMFEKNELLDSNQLESFKTPEQEIAFLKNKLDEKVSELETKTGATPERERVANKLVEQYKEVPRDDAPGPAALAETDIHQIVHNLPEEKHDSDIAKLYSLMLHKGVKNTLDIVEKLNQPHLTDDFHRFLVQYLSEKHSIKGLSTTETLGRALDSALFQVELPAFDEENKPTFYSALMDQFLSGLSGIFVSDKKATISLEIATPAESSYLFFYISIPRRFTDMLEKLVNGLFPEAKFQEVADDYNIFYVDGDFEGAFAELTEPYILPIRTYDEFENDPMSTLISSFSKLAKKGEGAALQITFTAESGSAKTRVKDMMKELSKGLSWKEALEKTDQSFTASAKRFGKELFNNDKKGDEEIKPKASTEIEMELAKIKSQGTLHPTNIRIVSSAPTKERADEILGDIATTFNIYAKPHGNSISWKNIKKMERGSLQKISYSEDLISQNQSY
jgi:hypothetical protein